MDSDEGKIFVSGISQDTDENLLRAHFSKFGEVLHVNVIRDQATGLNVGFAFVTFSDPAVVDRLQDKHHIDNQYVDVKRRTSGEVQNPAGRSGNLNSSRSFDSGVNVQDNRIFVGGLPYSLTTEDLRAYFEVFGRVTHAVIMIDQQTQRPKGYGFVSFHSEDSMVHALHTTYHELKGKRVEVNRAHFRKVGNPAAGGFPVYGGSGGSGHRVASASGGGTGVFLGNGGAGAASASGSGGAGAFPVYGGSSGSGYEVHMDSNIYMQLQNTGGGYPPYGASGYGGYGYPAGDPGVPGASGPSSSRGAQVPSGYGNVEYGNAAPGGSSAIREQVGGSAGYGYGGVGGYGYPAGAPYGDPGVQGASGPSSSWELHSGYGNVEYGNAAPGGGFGPGSAVREQVGGSAGYGYGGVGGYGYPTGAPYGDPGVQGASGPSSSWGAQLPSAYGNVEYGNAAPGGGFGPGSAVREQVGGSAGYGYGGVGGYGYPAGAPYANPGVPGASGPSSSWGAQVSSSYGNVEYGNEARGGGFGPGSAVMEQVGGSADYGYGGNDSWYGTPSAFGAVDGQYGNIHNTHGSGSGYADASNDSGGYGNLQRNNRQAGSGGSCGKGKQVQQ